MSAIDVIYEGDDGPWVVARAAQRGTRTVIEYTDEHLGRDAELAPVRHPDQDRTRQFDGRDDTHLPGLLADALPDSWGRSVLRRDMRQHGIEAPTQMQMLTWLGRRTMGALTFRPVDGPDSRDAALVDLDRVQAEVLRHLAGQDTSDESADAVALAAGSGAGGARPKITAAITTDGALVADNGALDNGATPWLVKFHSPEDNPELSAIEATYLQMAAAAGITTCDHQLISGSSGAAYLAVRRFDRAAVPDGAPRRIHMATAAGLLEAYPERGQHLSYDDAIRLTRRVTGDTRDITELVRRAVFNVIAHNRDDHARNIAYLWTPTEQWRLAPAYDLTHSMGPRPTFAAADTGEHYLDVAGKGAHITRADLIGLRTAAGLKPSALDDIIDATLAAVEEWPELAAANNVPDTLIDEVATRLPALAP